VAVDPLTARQLEVVRGPMSLLYGSSALGGVINVVREEVPTTMPEHGHGVVSAQAASVNRGSTLGGYWSDRAGPIAVRARGATARRATCARRSAPRQHAAAHLRRRARRGHRGP
jgi:iron complex outermembrane receptor protein